jgi:transcriptional regulator with XRE-family HTH domain
MKTRPPIPVQRAFRELGANLENARLIQRITVAQLAERAGVSLSAVRSLLHGEGSSSIETVFRVTRSLGLLQGLVDATDPFKTGAHRGLMEESLPRRVKTRRDEV